MVHQIYVASASKTVDGADAALERLGEIAREYSMTVLMANSVGVSDGAKSAGLTSVWNDQGDLVGQMDGEAEGILVVDTESGRVLQLTV